MTRPYNERRNKQVVIMVERRKIAPKDVPAALVAAGFVLITYETVRQILSKYRRTKFHNISQHFTPHL